MMKTPELKPCPFCGRTDGLAIVSCGCEMYEVHCIFCQVKQGKWHGLEEAVDAWNRRAEREQNGNR